MFLPSKTECRLVSNWPLLMSFAKPSAFGLDVMRFLIGI
jgi:hypothetical protein